MINGNNDFYQTALANLQGFTKDNAVNKNVYPKTTLIEKSITENDTYNAADDEANGYSSVTVNVSSGGGASSGNDVKFYDYDGSVVASYSAADFANLSAMPANPTHEGLTAQGWNWSLADAKAYVAAYGKLNIGQMYITSDGKTRFYFTVTKEYLTIDLYLNLGYDTELDIDWGDNSAHTTWTSADGDSSKSHEYASAGRYVISVEVITGEVYLSQALSKIYEIEIGNGVVGIDASTFYGRYSLSSVTIPNSVTSIGSYAFSECYALSSVTIPNSVTSIIDNAFSHCSSLSSVTIPNSVTSIGEYAFSFCPLSSITISDSVTSISDYAFSDCYSLSSVTIPDSVTNIGGGAFNQCYALSSITFESSTPPNLSSYLMIPDSCIIRVPQGSLSAYTSDENYPEPGYYIYEEY